MFASVKGYYDGKKIVMEEDVELEPGQEVIVTIINAQHRFQKVDLSRYAGRGEKLFETDAQEYVKELRNHDRI